jgi:hypothetical protein
LFIYRDEGQRIGIVLKKFAPFLKIYVDYILNFDNATGVINAWAAKSPKFAAFLAEVQVLLSDQEQATRYGLILTATKCS